MHNYTHFMCKFDVGSSKSDLLLFSVNVTAVVHIMSRLMKPLKYTCP